MIRGYCNTICRIDRDMNPGRIQIVHKNWFPWPFYGPLPSRLNSSQFRAMRGHKVSNVFHLYCRLSETSMALQNYTVQWDTSIASLLNKNEEFWNNLEQSGTSQIFFETRPPKTRRFQVLPITKLIAKPDKIFLSHLSSPRMSFLAQKLPDWRPFEIW